MNRLWTVSVQPGSSDLTETWTCPVRWGTNGQQTKRRTSDLHHGVLTGGRLKTAQWGKNLLKECGSKHLQATFSVEYERMKGCFVEPCCNRSVKGDGPDLCMQFSREKYLQGKRDTRGDEVWIHSRPLMERNTGESSTENSDLQKPIQDVPGVRWKC